VTPSGGYWGENTWSDVVVDPDTPNVIYAAQGNYVEATDNGVYTSPVGGTTWLEFAGIPNGRTAWVGRIALAAGPGHVLYIAMVYSQDDPNAVTDPNSYYYGKPLAGTLEYMGRLDNANFTSPNAPTPNDLTAGTPNFCGSGRQGWYDLVLGVDPSNSSHIFAAGAYDYNFQNDAILQSTTGGASWNDITTAGGVEPHTDYHAMAFDSSNRLLVGNDGGIWRYDTGLWTILNGDLNTIQFYGISLHPTNPQIVLGGGQDNGSEIYTGNPVWNTVTGGDGGYANISQTNPNVMYTTYTQGVTYGSVDGGNTFPQIFPYPGLSINTSLFNFITPTITDPLNGDRLFIGGDYIWETTDDGAHWTPHTNPSGLPVDSIAVLPGGNTIYIAVGGTFNLRGFVYRSDDDGNTWTQAAYTTPNSYHIHEIDIDPNDPTGQTAVAVIDRADPASGHVFRTTTGGATWTDITGNLPAVPTWSAKIDRDANQTIYVSNDNAVYAASSPYTSWSAVGAGLPNVQGFNLQLNENPHELGLATHGRGAWLIGSLSISKSLAPKVIETGQPSVVTLTLTNTTGALQNQASFTDTLVNMQAAGGAVTGTCGAAPATLAAGATALSFSGISLPDQGTCTVIFSVTSYTPGVQTNTTSGLTGLALVTPLPSLPSNTVQLTVIAPPTIGKAFLPTTISPGNNSVVTLTLSNSNPLDLTSGAFTDTLVHMSAVGGAVGGTCVGTTPNTLAAGATALSFSKITIPANNSCTVTFSVTSNTAGAQPNTTSGVTTTQTTTPGAASNTATLTVSNLPTIAKAFNPNAILPGANSVVTLTLTSSSVAALTGGAFTDTLVNMSAIGGTCVGTTPATLSGGATSLSFSGITIPANGSCTVTFTITSNTIGTQPNTTSGVTTTQTTTAGAASNTAKLYVLAVPTITKAFNPQSIISGLTSLVTLTLTNSNAVDLNGGAVTDTLANMSAAAGAVGGTCVGTNPPTLAAGATALSFSGITIPANSTCTVTFSVTSTIVGAQPNTTSGVTTTQTPTAGPASNTPSLIVYAVPTITKAFSPAAITSSGNSVVTLTLSNTTPNALVGANFSDTLVNMSAVSGAVTGTCVGTTPNTLAAGATALGFTAITIPKTSSCTVIFSVTSSTLGVQNNTTTGVTTSQTTTAGPPSNTATLTVSSAPTIAKAFNPATIASAGNSVVTLTLANSNASALTGGAFTDTLVNMSALGGAVGGTCVGTTPNTLPAGATALSFTGIAIPANGNCTVIFSVTSSTVGGNPNTTSGVTTTQTPAAGAASNTATLTVTALATPTIAKAFNPATIASGGNSAVTLTLTNSNASALTGGGFSDTLVNMSALGGAVGGTCAGITPNTLAAGAAALSFTGITIPANGNCTVTFSITSNTAGAHPNTTSGVTTTQTPAAGAASNTATLTVLSSPTIGKAFNPAAISSGGNSAVTLTLTNSNASALTGGGFSDTLVNMSALGGAVGGTCSGTTPNSLAAGATALSFTGIAIPANGNCTVTFSVTSSTVGGNPNTTSGVTTTQTPAAGAASNTATLTVTASSQPIDVSSQVKVTTSGLVFSRATGTFNGTLTITNIGTTAIAAPLQSVFTNLIAGATLVSRTGIVPYGPYAGAPYMTVPGVAPLAPGASVTISVKFTYTGTAPISYVSKTLSGAF
jgi:hypothetical protein